MLKILTFSTLYPNAAQPYHGIFVEERLRRLVATGELTAHVVAPVPWFPFNHPLFGRYAPYARVPSAESRYDITVEHPRFPVIPKIGMTIAPALMARAVMPLVQRLHAEHRFNLIDAHYFYPDGVAAVRVAKRLGVPLAITARGSDINVISQFERPREQILAAMNFAASNITVSQALKDVMVGLGVDDARVMVLPNGVDLDKFRPMNAADRAAQRRALGLKRTTILSVGALIPLKGHDITIEALAQIPDTELIIVGEGAERAWLEAVAEDHGVADRVRFAGRQSHDELVGYYNAADMSLLASQSEGMANVILESLACGTPVIATRVGGNPEMIAAPAAGELADVRTPNGLVAAYHRLAHRAPCRAQVRQYGERFGWRTTVLAQIELYKRIAATRYSV